MHEKISMKILNGTGLCNKMLLVVPNLCQLEEICNHTGDSPMDMRIGAFPERLGRGGKSRPE